ncbi:uncharacterized protein BXZ73DRAFT_43968 [Epithele typhae]|uniref:uncharacterized protein n=1 Tax=Epithele typhae TaxID=378194 RepID=UPI002007CC4F|nr:uncharacterized protein BXZ73DRAFT_43968 [Epithele typhae]KAH9939367.1 hypothetical protein BXZ73DRAFT_43968 [Epithele typhae]
MTGTLDPPPELQSRLNPKPQAAPGSPVESVTPIDDLNSPLHYNLGPLPESDLPLLDLLDLSQLDTIHDLDARFHRIAHELLHNHLIEVRSPSRTDHLQLLEIEVYLYKSGCHEDPFTHASHEQSQCGRWYFHRPPGRTHDPGLCLPTIVSSNGYRGGSRKGLDLTIGRPGAQATHTSKYFPLPASSTSSSIARPNNDTKDVLRGGILLRSARRLSDGHVINGPSVLVDNILRMCGAKNIEDLVRTHWQSDIHAFEPASAAKSGTGVPTGRLSTGKGKGKARARADPEPAQGRIYRSPRIGLDISNATVIAFGGPGIGPASAAHASSAAWHPRVRFVGRPYRFFVSPSLYTLNGRGQTFVGVHDALISAGMYADGVAFRGELVRLTGYMSSTVDKYFEALHSSVKNGLKGEGMDEWVGPKGKTVHGSPSEWLKMIGTLKGFGAVPGVKVVLE